ncbi:hypothetical protein MLD38_000908 [Melastoma candidum]|uniref:Uncharacterized protein n=1 Tax=Melastoma candidum TaxID=119954 RepID=A0ACB9SFI7_9MYRT|nr:hypothetical protein MLD38_000908 [Melastoma candidum]
MEYQNMNLMSLSFHKKNFFKHLTKLALSLSLFSLLLSTWINPCHLSAIFSFGFNLLDHQISPFLSRLLKHGADKNHMFLLCNGILVFLAKSSGLIRDGYGRQSRGGTIGVECSWMNGEEGGWRSSVFNEEGVYVYESEMALEDAGKGDGDDGNNEDEDGEGVKEIRECCSEDCGEQEAGNVDDVGIRAEESEEEDGSNEDVDCILDPGSLHEITTAEDLNRKFDEFIRKVREEISMGSSHVPQQQHPVLG